MCLELSTLAHLQAPVQWKTVGGPSVYLSLCQHLQDLQLHPVVHWQLISLKMHSSAMGDLFMQVMIQ